MHAAARPAIEIEGASTHNLKSVSCRIPHQQMTVITGVSGSGKSSLAFDTLYAEGQRRYVETLSTYARQFLQQMKKPPVRDIRNLAPALALRQGNGVSNPHSSVGSVTELHDHLALLFGGAGTVFCARCSTPVKPWDAPALVRALQQEHAGERVLVLGTWTLDGEEVWGDALRLLATQGHRRLWHEGRALDIDAPDVGALEGSGVLQVVLDRLRVGEEDDRLTEAVETALSFADGFVEVALWDRREGDGVPPLRRFYPQWRCSACGYPHHMPIPALFNPQSSIGACGACRGSGHAPGLRRERIVPNPLVSLHDGAVVPLETPSQVEWKQRLIASARTRGVDPRVPWRTLSEADQRWVFRGGSDGWPGVEAWFRELELDHRNTWARITVARYRGISECPACEGTGLSEEARAVRLGGHHLARVQRLRIDEVQAWLTGLSLPDEVGRAIEHLLAEIRQRLGFLMEAGVGYLTLDRQARTLSGGEMHRILLATCVGRQLTDTCYVLDEPTAGLHPADTDRLLGVMERLRDVGNTVVVVEHDPDVIRRADWLIELGPRAGDHGGQVMFEGRPSELLQTDGLMTSEALRRRVRPIPEVAADIGRHGWMHVRHATLHNLEDVHIDIPRRALSVLTGVSGSGKSTLLHACIHHSLAARMGEAISSPCQTLEIDAPWVKAVHLVEQSGMGTSSRSCPLSVCGAYPAVRELFAAEPVARERKLGAGAFSFNVPGGRCEACEGTGVQTIEMHFMADIELPCEVCEGRRFREPVLDVRVRGRSIADVLDMTIAEAVEFFADRPQIARRLLPMARVGLGYLRLGQATSRLSGGELQRLKLSGHLGSGLDEGSDGSQDGAVFLLDEPTLGLHMHDVEVLLHALQALVERGATVVVIEHNLDLIAAADWVMDLGPGAGPDGGRVVYQGTVPGLVACESSVTARYLNESFGWFSSGP
jgi:excinuclease ABC subunit A